MKIQSLLIGALIALCIAGCTTDEYHVHAPPPDYWPKVTPPVPVLPPAVDSPPTADVGGFMIAEEANTKLRVNFAGPWSGSDSAFCEKLAEKLAESINETRNIRLVSGAPFDLNVMIKPEFEVFDRDGEYVRVNCRRVNVSIRPMFAYGQSILAVKSVTPKDMPRQLGLDRAKEQYLPAVAQAFAPFLNKELTYIGDTMLAATDIKFALRNPMVRPTAKRLALEVAKIDSVLKSTSGVVSFQNIYQDTEAATCTFRVVYLREAFPQGISNVVNLRLMR